MQKYFTKMTPQKEIQHRKSYVQDTKGYKNEQNNDENTRYVIKFTPITPEERERLRISVYDYLL